MPPEEDVNKTSADENREPRGFELVTTFGKRVNSKILELKVQMVDTFMEQLGGEQTESDIYEPPTTIHHR